MGGLAHECQVCADGFAFDFRGLCVRSCTPGRRSLDIFGPLFGPHLKLIMAISGYFNSYFIASLSLLDVVSWLVGLSAEDTPLWTA